ncbi:MAG: class II aldolase/adducin family protein [Alphaproteobacteria bacterium]|nr:class II aldolase/adducin family protein [Alphaproteobacteria bacterium]
MAEDIDRDRRDLVARSCRVLGGLELTKAATGHVSQRAADGKHVLIRARGADEVGVRYTTADEVIKVDMNGQKVDGPDGLAVPQEVFIHTWVYKTRPEVQSVIHIHPPTVVLFTICEKPLMPLYGAYDPSSLYIYLEGIPTYGRSVTISNDELGKDFTDAMGEKNVCLMRGHGITTAGATVEEATVTAIKLNELAEMNYRAHLLGDPKPIPDEDLADYRGRLEKRGGFSGSPHGASSWRYYERLSGA